MIFALSFSILWVAAADTPTPAVKPEAKPELPAPLVAARPEMVKFSAGRDAQAIADVVNAGLSDLRACESTPPVSEPPKGPDGKLAGALASLRGSLPGSLPGDVLGDAKPAMRAALTIASDGAVTEAHVVSSSGFRDEVVQCLLTVAKTLRFAKHDVATQTAEVPLTPERASLLQGSLDKELIRKVVSSHAKGIRVCYERGLEKGPLAGSLVLRFIVGKDGRVETSSVTKNEMVGAGAAATITCVEQDVLTWKFPEPKGGGIVIVNYPFKFRVSEGPQEKNPVAHP